MQHKKKIIIGILITIILIIIAIIAFITNLVAKKPFNSTGTVNFSISNGESFSTVMDNLSSEGVLNNESFAKLYVTLTGTTPNLTPGDYTINSNVTLSQFTNILNSQKNINVTIPEGYTVEQIATTLANFGLCTKEQFLSAVENYPLPEFIKKKDGVRYQLEGYLFPTTYSFKKGETPDEMIQNMINMFTVGLNQAIKETGNKITPTEIESVITKASIIQGEAKTSKDMALVSSVIDNRIKAKMPLQMDDTIIYALGKHVDKVYDKDLQINSPYNTYTHKGLPAGPICNPGVEAIEAALKPATSDYTYYILTDSANYFTNNYQDFLKEKAKVEAEVASSKTPTTVEANS